MHENEFNIEKIKPGTCAENVYFIEGMKIRPLDFFSILRAVDKLLLSRNMF